MLPDTSTRLRFIYGRNAVEMKVLTSLKRRWDSSDPERAPPPLPLNPGSSSPTTKANTSAGIAAAAKRIVEQARESAPLSSYTRNQTPEASPERSLIKGAHHKRMQSLQPGNVKDLRSYLDSNRSPERSPERPSSRGLNTYSRQNSKDDIFSSYERSSTPTPTPATRDPLKETPTLRPSTRQPPRAILGENTPPSATMLALQTMQVPDDPLNDITNRAGTPSTPRVNTNYDFSSQLLNITTIATNLQREMAQLSRRSKDNATDLISLKEATNARDEDIRKSLRDLATSVTAPQGLLGPPPLPGTMSRSTSSYGNNYLDSKAYSSPPSASKSYNLPRAASAHSFLDDGRVGSPSPYSVEGAASVAMLEKIIREMVTKEGQERLLGTLSELFEKSSKDNVEAAKKVEELAGFIKEKSETQALVRVPRSADGGPPKLELNFDSPGALDKVRDAARKGSSDPAADSEMMKLLQRIKESIQLAGGTSAETKGLVRDLRGEVLGMGRDLGRRLDQVSEAQLNSSLDKSIEDGQGSQSAEQIQQIVEEGIAELKAHLSGMMRQKAEEDDTAFKQLATTKTGPDGEEMFAVVKHALAEHHELTRSAPSEESEIERLDRDGVLDAVKEGLKDFEPNIELQQFGLERDEILAVLKEGLQDYQDNKSEPAAPGIDKAEVFEAMQEALKDFQPPVSEDSMANMKDEILANVQQALADFRPVAPVPPMEDEATRAAVLEAVKEGLANHGPAAPREIEISRDDLFDAVKASLDGTTIPFGGFGEQVLQQLHELIEGMRVEFKQYSAANGRDTEQVLDAVKDGLESLRAEIESYVDRAQDVTGKDEIVDTVKAGLEQLRTDVQGYVKDGPDDNGKAEMLEYIKAEFEHLHEAVANSRDLDGDGEPKEVHTAAIILAIKEGMDELKSHVGERGLGENGDLPEEMMEAMKEEFEQLKAAVLNAHAADKSELVETIQDSMGALHAKLGGSETATLSGGSSEEVIGMMREEFAALKENLASTVGEADRDAIVEGVKQAIDDLRTTIIAEQDDAAEETIAAIKEELERFKETMSTAVVLGGAVGGANAGATADNSEALSALRESLEEIKETVAKSPGAGGVSEELLEALRGEFENLRGSIATSVVHGGSNEEVMDAIRLGLDDIRSDLEKKMDNPERAQQHHSEVLDALNEGLENLRSDVVKTLDKPLDMTVNYEILDTLKDGLAGLRADIDKLKDEGARPATPKGGEIVLAESAEVGETRELSAEDVAAAEAASAPSASGINRTDLEKMEVLLAQLQIKVEAMDATVQDLPINMHPAPAAEGTAMKDDLIGMEALIREVQCGMAALATKPPSEPTPEGAARKEDTDALETLLRNMKAQLEEMAVPDPAIAVTKEHLDGVEAVVRLAHEAVEGVADKLENHTAGKADVAVVEILAQDIKLAIEEVREKVIGVPSEEEQAERMTKADLDVLGVLCTEIKTKVSEMALPDPEEMPTKADIKQLQGLINDFRESHDKMKDSYENDIAITAKAFDDRKQEFEDTVKQIEDVKESLVEVKDELLAKLTDSESGVNTLGETLKGLEEKTTNEAVSAEIKTILETLTSEFEKAHGSLEGIKVDHEESAATALEKQGEHKEAVVTELGDRLDTLFDGLMSKYDDAQKAAEEKAATMEEKAAQQQELLDSTKTMADDLKLSIDTLGTALTTFTATFPEQMDKMAEESKTVFNRVDDTYNKLDETQEGLKFEHSITREEVAKVMGAVSGLQSDLTDHNPRFMMTLKEVQALVGQHYDHSRQASTAAADHAQAVRDLQDLVRSATEKADTHNEELKTNISSGFSGLPALMPPPTEAAPVIVSDKYDDSRVHEKLDRLMGHAELTADSSTQLQRLDQIHEKVMATAAEVSAFVTLQAKQITQDHESKEKEAEEVALLLERRLVQKDQIEADITVLNEEKDSLRTTVEALKAEREALAAQKSRMQADVASLETALHIRRDELHAMDVKAETIERRMLEGVMNQSRMLLLAKSPKSPPKKKPMGRDLRVPSNASAMSAQTVTSSLPPLKANHALAMRSRPPFQRNGATPNTAERRIMSLSQINHNVPTGGHAFQSTTPSLVSSGPQSMKRSHSVKTQFMRKATWGGKRNLSLSANNKENDVLSEESEEDFEPAESHNGNHEEFGSDVGTERRTSYASGTESGLTYGTGSYTDGITPGTEGDRRMSYGTSDLSYGTGSYMTGSELDRRTSLGSTINGTLGVESGVDEEPAQEEQRRGQTATADFAVQEQAAAGAPFQLEAAPGDDEQEKEKHYYAPPSDSGLGTDLPTAALSSTGGDYFK